MSSEEAKKLYERLTSEGEAAGYLLNPDVEFVFDLMEGLITSEKRYGYWACPCRLADGTRDLDIICPCDYRDPDLDEYGACYCALYVSEEVLEGKRDLGPIPERRKTGTTESTYEHQDELIGFTRTGIRERGKSPLPYPPPCWSF